MHRMQEKNYSGRIYNKFCEGKLFGQHYCLLFEILVRAFDEVYHVQLDVAS